MNLFKLGASVWLLALILILIALLAVRLTAEVRDSFTNYPQQVNPLATPNSNPDAANANNNYASILLFIQQNPQQSGKFIADVKQKFFSDDCTVKNNIDFPNIAQMPAGMPFS